MNPLPTPTIPRFILVTSAQLRRTACRQHNEIVLVLLLAVLTGCGPTPDVHKGFVNDNQPVEELAIVRGVTAGMHVIDGQTMVHPNPNKAYKEAYLPPGQHTISLGRQFWFSTLIVPQGILVVVSKPFTVDLEAGHIYELHGDRTTGTVRMALWIQDSATGVVVARDDNPQVLNRPGTTQRKSNAEVVEANRIKLEAQCKAQPERC